ncbi:MAG: 3-dehydroquinate synthase, partial [Candidatus Thorarchaeota archaeon]
MIITRFEIETQTRTYPVIIGQDLLESIGEFIEESTGRIFVITDETISDLYLEKVIRGLRAAGFIVFSQVLKLREESKSLSSVNILYDFLVEFLATRSDIIVALGGGVVGDVAGFAASTFKRGMQLVHVPTTLLSQVDSSIGGKTGVNLDSGKNLVGTFYQPHAVIIDVATLNSLSKKEFAAGLAEVIKYGITMDKDLLQILQEEHSNILNRQPEVIARIAEKSVRNKKFIIERDEREEKGIREILNFGHTIGHAVEICSNHSLLHGEAVSIGMVEEARLAVRKGHLKQADFDSLISI